MHDVVAHLRTEPGQDVPAEVRLRRLLKAALRAYGFRCVALELPPVDPAPLGRSARRRAEVAALTAAAALADDADRDKGQ